jgi:hypothetical protein
MVPRVACANTLGDRTAEDSRENGVTAVIQVAVMLIVELGSLEVLRKLECGHTFGGEGIWIEV